MKSGLALLIYCHLATASALAMETDEPDLARLRAAGIATDATGISAYLQSLIPSDDTQQRLHQLVTELGSRDFQRRERAMRDLLETTDPPLEALWQAARSPDPEVRTRAQRILPHVKHSDQAPTLLVALRFVSRHRPSGLTSQLFALLPHWREPHMQRAIAHALSRSACADNEPLLRRVMAGEGSTMAQAAAVMALARACGPNCEAELLELRHAPDEHLRLAAADGLAHLQNRECLTILGQLLESDDFQIRLASSQLLRSLTGQRFGYASYATPAMRAPAVRSWRQWIAERGPTADLSQRHDREFPSEVGHVLIGQWSDGTLIELNGAGEVVLEAAGFKYLWGCQGLPSGHRLALDSNPERRTLTEYDLDRRPCWKREGLPGSPTGVERLASGNTLIATSEGELVVEIDPGGHIVWQVKLSGRPTTAQRLANGNTLINLQDIGAVVEVDQAGAVQWRLDGLTRVITAEGLENGNVLVCDMRLGKVAEYNRAHQLVWSHEGFSNPAQAQRLPNGNTLVADESGLHEITVSGQEIWTYSISRSRFHRF